MYVCIYLFAFVANSAVAFASRNRTRMDVNADGGENGDGKSRAGKRAAAASNRDGDQQQKSPFNQIKEVSILHNDSQSVIVNKLRKELKVVKQQLIWLEEQHNKATAQCIALTKENDDFRRELQSLDEGFFQEVKGV